ncbi:MAG: hypothetical protein ACJAWV_004432 [Flammeovirgaceae bacterium]|jgi:hypothetical protein
MPVRVPNLQGFLGPLSTFAFAVMLPPTNTATIPKATANFLKFFITKRFM